MTTLLLAFALLLPLAEHPKKCTDIPLSLFWLVDGGR
jgi:hypothetical protein